MTRSAVLICIDGWGITADRKGNAIAEAATPVMDALSDPKTGGYAVIAAHGLDVGLPEGVMGNSEVGHLTIGAGRVEYQDLVRINLSISDGSFIQRPALVDAFNRAREGTGRIHFLGLVSDGGVHSHILHLYELLNVSKNANVPEAFVHFFADGRDTPPKSAYTYAQQLQEFFDSTKYGKLATVTGRYYAMDRDKRWERVEKAYRCILGGEGEVASESSASAQIQAKYLSGETDEFLKPMIFDTNGIVRSGDTLVFFNYRSDRMREIVEAVGIAPPFDVSSMDNVPVDLGIVQFTLYNQIFNHIPVVFPAQSNDMAISEFLSSKGIKQCHIAETEKYAHVTFFFNGGVEKAWPGEDRVLVDSPKGVATYDLAPSMSVAGVADEVAKAVKSKEYSFVVCNLAPPDMVGHTGNYEKTVEAVEATDAAIGVIRDACASTGAILFVTSDHGNAEVMLDESGLPKTSHTTNPVPFMMFGDPSLKFKNVPAGLQDVAPTILEVMGFEIPPQMTGHSLLV
uniref:phosphoglycerate mutase (2,3-diphosphoglycerate-independent) n=1 Tax=Spongospora subterranea TaxID=70186 RepID=A0A0H5RC42_9EUKA|eukprot:CRZ06074.1 hypothetical protein [Spongospora subterranea]